jgi:hypothetical protein
MSTLTYVDFRGIWLREARSLEGHPAVRAALQALSNEWESMAEFHLADASPEFMVQERAEYALRLATFPVKKFDWSWLVHQYEPDQLAPLQLAVCQEKFPHDSWEVLHRFEHYVVTNAKRTLVCDVIHCDSLSAAASLTLAGQPGVAGSEEAVRFMEGRVARERAVADELEKLVTDYQAGNS